MEYDLVFEGGGAKGMVFAGALQEFEERGHTVGRVMGTSAGAITATGIAAGYSADEVLDALTEQEDGQPVFVSFLGTPEPFSDEEIEASVIRSLLRAVDVPLLPERTEARLKDRLLSALMRHPRSRHIFSFVERGGWYTADAFVAWLQRRLDTGTFQGQRRNFSNMTMSEFFEATGRHLSLVAADTTANRLLVLNRRTAPDLPVVWATRMSMSFPLLWPEVVWQPEWGAYLEQPMDGHLIVDGGLLSNFPIELFISPEPHVTHMMGPKQHANVVGFLIDESLPVQDAPRSAPPGDGGGLSLGQLATVQRIQRLVDTATQAHDKMVIEAFDYVVCRLPAKGYGTTEFDMSEERREALVAAGRRAAATYFDTIESEADLVERSTRASALEMAMEKANRLASDMLRP